MKEFYTIGEISKIFNVSTDTLRFYHKNGLLVPDTNGENGYRYYSKSQFEIISTILLLRSLGTPINSLKQILNENSAKGIDDELLRNIGEIDNQIKQLTELKERAKLFESNIQDTCYTEEITIQKVPRFWLISKSFGDEDELDIEEILKINVMAKRDWSSLASIVSTITKENLLAGNFHTYEKYGYLSEIECNVQSEYLEVLESRQCVCGNAKVCTLEHSEIDAVYKKMIDYAHSHGYEIAGDAIERNILDLYAGNQTKPTIFFKLYIPVKTK